LKQLEINRLGKTRVATSPKDPLLFGRHDGMLPMSSTLHSFGFQQLFKKEQKVIMCRFG